VQLLYGFKNRFANGNMNIWQRGTTVTTQTDVAANAVQTYGPDRWFCRSVGGTITSMTQGTADPDVNSDFNCQITGAVNVTTVDFGQRIDSALVLQGMKQVMAFSCWIYNNTGGSITPALVMSTHDGTADIWAGTNIAEVLNTNLQPCANAAWTRVTWTGDISQFANLSNGLEISVRIPSGSLNSSAKNVNFAQMQIEIGNTVTNFDVVPTVVDLLRCQRYASTSYNEGGVPGTASSSSGGVMIGLNGTYAIGNISFPAKMAASPVITLYGYDGTAARIWSYLTSTNMGGVAAAGNISDTGFRSVSIAGSPLTAGGGYMFNWFASADL
jgi:hypothetical protein